jgi:hypothetical protein
MPKTENSVGHTQLVKICPQCERSYYIQLGGQKAGSSPATRVSKPGEAAQGFCSVFCSNRSVGQRVSNVPDWLNQEGIFYPPKYLSPARRIENFSDKNPEGGDING